MMTFGGRFRIPQRFGVDWVRVDATANASNGADVLAVADGTIAHVTDGIPDNAAGRPPAAAITLENVGGNVVVLDIGSGRYVFYAHLQRGLPVKPGERVRKGQVLGKIGNSGDSAGPHLHFHVMDAPLHGEGVPFAFESFDVVGGPAPGRRAGVSPMNGARVRFPE
jgi:murein DD-endopeptidase MepM/ murein hydrolase activator NlpD